MRTFALLSTLALAACGGGSNPRSNGQGLALGPPPSGIVHVRAVPSGTFPDSRLGQYREEGQDGVVEVREEIVGNVALVERAIAHELGHACGIDHMNGTGCYMDPDAHQTTGPLCPPEIAAIQATAFTITVYVGISPPPLHTRTSAAAQVWNNAASRVVLAVQ